MTTILIKKKDTAGVPAPGDLTNAAGGTEIAVNTATKRIYTKDSGGNVVELGTNPSAITDNLLFSPDNTLDIGASGTSRPRSMFLGTNITVGSLTSTRVPYASTGGLLVDSANMTFNGTDLTVSGAVNAGTINATTLDLTNLEVTNIKAKDGTAGMQIADSTGVVSFTSNPVLTGGTAKGVSFLNASKVLTTGSALEFDGTNFGVGTAGNTMNHKSVLYMPGVVAGYFQVANGSTGLASTNGIRLGLTAAGLGELYAPTSMASYINNSEQMRLTSTGLGIGTSSPNISGVTKALTIDGSDAILEIANSGTIRATLYGNSSGAAFSGVGSDGIRFFTSASGATTERMRLDSSGNLGLGVTPSAVSASDRVLQVRNFLFNDNTNGYGILRYNNFFNGTNDVYLNTGAVSAFQMQGNSFKWYQAPSGTAGNAISFTQAMTLDASGRLLVGHTSATDYGVYTLPISIQGTLGSYLELKGNNSQAGTLLNINGSTGWFYGVNAGGSLRIAPMGTIDQQGVTNAKDGSSGMTLDASGNLGVGITAPVPYNAGARIIQSHNSGGAASELKITNTTTGTAATAGLLLLQSGLDAYVWNGSNSFMAFGTNNLERARITSGGDLLVGTTSYSASSNTSGVGLNPVGQIAVQRDGGFAAVFNRFTSDGGIILFRRSAVDVGSIDVTTTATAYTTSSDYRLKNTIAPMTGALAKVALLKPCTYKWNADGSDGEGFIAHELAEVVPQCVTGEKDAVDAEGKPQYQGIDTSFLVATLTAAIQEQQAIINSLKARLDAANL